MKEKSSIGGFPFNAKGIIVSLLILVPWMAFSSYLWVFSSQTFLLPLSTESFRFFFDVLGSHRLVLNLALLQPVLLFICIFGPLALIIWFFVLKRAFKDLPLATFWAMTTVFAFYELGAPGRIPTIALEYIFVCIIISALLTEFSSLAFWLIGTLALIIGVIGQKYVFLIFWTTFSLVLGYLINFFFAEKGRFSRRFRMRPKLSLFSGIGLSCLAFFILLTTYQFSFQSELTVYPDKSWWLAWIVAVLCFVLSWLQPWETSKWISLVIFAHGILLSPSMKLPLYFILGWFVVVFLCQIPLPSGFQKTKIFSQGIRGFKIAWILLISFFIYRAIRNDQPERTFYPSWISAFKEIKSNEVKNYLIVGEGLPLLSLFSHSNFLRNEELLLESSEEKFSDYLKSQEIDEVIIDKNYLNHFWKKWIAEGNPPEQANLSVVSRLISYNGEAIETPTLKLEKIKYFQKKDFEKVSSFSRIVFAQP